MENLINWIELPTGKGGKRTKLNDLEFSSFRSNTTKSKNKGNYLIFSKFIRDVFKDKTKLRIGKINDKIVIQFNNESGVNLYINNADKEGSLRASSKAFVDLLYSSYNVNKTESTNYYKLIELGNDSFLIEKI